MIKAENAVLRVKHIRQSRNGAFCIADLTTDFGEFKVKDPLLDQFKEGEYDATVWISEIYMAQYIAYGKAVTEMRARLHDLQVTSENYYKKPPEPTELDPMDEPQPVRLPLATSKDKASAPQAASGKPNKDSRWDKFKKPGKTDSAPITEAPAEEGGAIFDADMQQALERREPIQLDRAADRALLREQVKELKTRGYAFDAKQQTWLCVL